MDRRNASFLQDESRRWGAKLAFKINLNVCPSVSAISASALSNSHFSKVPRPGQEIYISSVSYIENELETRISYIPQDELEQSYRKDAQKIMKKLPDQFYSHEVLFSKEASDLLTPPKPYDHKIELIKEKALLIEPFRQQSFEQLQETKRYILNN